MDGTRAVAAALLLCVASISGVVVADTSGGDAGTAQQTTTESGGSMTVFAADNTSGYLAPQSDAVDRTGSRTTGLDVAGAVEADAGRVESAFHRSAIERRYRNAGTAEERRAVLEDGVEELSNRVDELSAREETAIRRYSEGSIDARRLLWTLAVVGREAEETNAALAWIEETADGIGANDEAERAAAEQVRLVAMHGPVREALVSSLAGEGAIRAHVETADGGFVIAAVDPAGDTYLREAHDPSAKTGSIGDQYGGNPSPALERFGELYPWTIERFEAIDALGPEQVRLYRFRSTHEHGELETYLDSGSTEILYERQRLDPETIPASAIERTEGDLRLVVNATRGGGPVGISLVETTSGDPVDAEIEVNGDRIGTTDGGRLWTVAPRGQAAINATYAGETVTVETTFE